MAALPAGYKSVDRPPAGRHARLRRPLRGTDLRRRDGRDVHVQRLRQ